MLFWYHFYIPGISGFSHVERRHVRRVKLLAERLGVGDDGSADAAAKRVSWPCDPQATEACTDAFGLFLLVGVVLTARFLHYRRGRPRLTAAGERWPPVQL